MLLCCARITIGIRCMCERHARVAYSGVCFVIVVLSINRENIHAVTESAPFYLGYQSCANIFHRRIETLCGG